MQCIIIDIIIVLDCRFTLFTVCYQSASQELTFHHVYLYGNENYIEFLFIIALCVCVCVCVCVCGWVGVCVCEREYMCVCVFWMISMGTECFILHISFPMLIFIISYSLSCCHHITTLDITEPSMIKYTCTVYVDC